MVLDLRRVFLGESEQLQQSLVFEMTDLPGELVSVSPVDADITVSNHAGLVVFSACVRFEGKVLCDRCCKSFDKSFAYSFSHILVSAPSDDDEGDDYIEAPDYMLDTDALLRDDILLELPSKFLCDESCKGLCPKCGKDLNEGECTCKRHEPDPRLAALSALLED